MNSLLLLEDIAVDSARAYFEVLITKSEIAVQHGKDETVCDVKNLLGQRMQSALHTS